MNDCQTNVRLDDPELRRLICQCWKENIEGQYSYAEINGRNETAQNAFLAVGQACSAQHGIRASLPGDVELGGGEEAPE